MTATAHRGRARVPGAIVPAAAAGMLALLLLVI
jgi:hypothetical protein